MKKILLSICLMTIFATCFAQNSPAAKILKSFSITDVPQNLVFVHKNEVNVREAPSTRAPRMHENFGMGYRKVGRWIYPFVSEKNDWYNIRLLPTMHEGWISGTLSRRVSQTPIDWEKHKNMAYLVQDGTIRVALHKETGLILMDHQVEIGSYDADDAISYNELLIGKQISPSLVVFYDSRQLDFNDNNNIANDAEFIKYRETHSVVVNMGTCPDSGGWMSYNLEDIPSNIILRIFGKPEKEINAQFGCVYITEDILSW